MVFFSYFNMVFNMVFNTPNINIFNTPWNFDKAFNVRYSFQHILKFSTCCFNIVFYAYYSFQHALKFSKCFQHTLKYIQHSFEHALQFSTCAEISNTQHALQFSEHSEIVNMLFYSFQNILKYSTCFFTVFRTYWNFQHAFLQFSEHAENFNMLFYSFQHSFSICFQHALQISTCSEIFNTLSNMKIWNIYSQIVTEPIPKYS